MTSGLHGKFPLISRAHLRVETSRTHAHDEAYDGGATIMAARPAESWNSRLWVKKAAAELVPSRKNFRSVSIRLAASTGSVTGVYRSSFLEPELINQGTPGRVQPYIKEV